MILDNPKHLQSNYLHRIYTFSIIIEINYPKLSACCIKINLTATHNFRLGMDRGGFEPPTSRVRGGRLHQPKQLFIPLNYRPVLRFGRRHNPTLYSSFQLRWSDRPSIWLGCTSPLYPICYTDILQLSVVLVYST